MLILTLHQENGAHNFMHRMVAVTYKASTKQAVLLAATFQKAPSHISMYILVF